MNDKKENERKIHTYLVEFVDGSKEEVTSKLESAEIANFIKLGLCRALFLNGEKKFYNFSSIKCFEEIESEV